LRRLLVIFLLCCSSLPLFSQFGLRGYIYDENNQPMQGVGVYIRNSNVGVYTDSKGKYYIELLPGQYDIIFQFIGYKNLESPVVINNKDIVKNVWMQLDDEHLQEITVKAKRRDPAYEIMQNVVERKHIYLKQYNSLTSTVYIKASEQKQSIPSRKERRKAQQGEVEYANNEDSNTPKIDNPFEDSAKKFNTNNLVEVFLTRHFEYPNKIKEIRNGYNQIGSKFGLYYLTTVGDDFNFYENMLTVGKLNETPVISPLNSAGILTYKFKLLGSYFDEENRTIFKIEVTPRKSGSGSVSGIIHIYDKTFNIKELDFKMEKGTLINFDEFNIIQRYEEVDSLWIINYQEFNYYTNTKGANFRGRTVVKYSDFIVNPEFKKRFFSNEVAITTQEAYERDSGYWESIRPEPLSQEEQEYIRLQDSIKAAHNKKEFLDSIDADFNKITFGKISYWGVGYRNREKRYQFDFGALPFYFRPVAPGGLRFAPYTSFYKEWKNRKSLRAWQSVHYGFRNTDVKGSGGISYYYNPYRLARINVSGGSEFDIINPYDAVINMLKRSNYFVSDRISVSHRIELVNGLYTNASVSFANRRPITNMKFGELMDWIPDNQPIEFDFYQALITSVSLSYVPFQKYMREPYRKVVLGSKWPEFSLTYEKGVKGLLSSDIDFDRIQFSIDQTIQIFTLGTTKYNVMTGKFINTRDLRFIDYKFFRQSDRIWYSNPLYSFQLLDTLLTTRGFYVEAHFIHHFNGSIISNIPLIKKTRINTAAGGGFMWVKENNYRHEELFVGMERVFRIKRQRFRVGAYYCIAESNQRPFASGFKVSFNYFSIRDNSWDF
jgi:hypothetical protein